MSRLLMTIRLTLGGGVCGSFLGMYAGAILGGIYGLVVGNFSYGLEGALLGAGSLFLVGMLYGIMVGAGFRDRPADGVVSSPPPAAPAGCRVPSSRPTPGMVHGAEWSAVPETRHLAY